MSPDDRQPVFLECRPCGFAWIACYVPMPLSAFARLLKRATCPKCGKHTQLYLYEPGRVPPAPPDAQEYETQNTKPERSQR